LFGLLLEQSLLLLLEARAERFEHRFDADEASLDCIHAVLNRRLLHRDEADFSDEFGAASLSAFAALDFLNQSNNFSSGIAAAFASGLACSGFKCDNHRFFFAASLGAFAALDFLNQNDNFSSGVAAAFASGLACSL